MTRLQIASAQTLAGAFSIAALVGCGGSSKPADAPSTCPDGTVLRGADCVPPGAANDAPTEGAPSGDTTPHETKAPSADAPRSTAAEDKFDDHPASAPSPSDSSGGASTPYDRDAVEAELKRGARQVKANCGAATDDDGQATGPWGRTKATIVLGRNGHVRQVSVPAPFDGKPVGVCVVHAFDKIWFPPYANPSDVSVDWDIDVVQPKH